MQTLLLLSLLLLYSPALPSEWSGCIEEKLAYESAVVELASFRKTVLYPIMTSGRQLTKAQVDKYSLLLQREYITRTLYKGCRQRLQRMH